MLIFLSMRVKVSILANSNSIVMSGAIAPLLTIKNNTV
jgi:hypothetical protein